MAMQLAESDVGLLFTNDYELQDRNSRALNQAQGPAEPRHTYTGLGSGKPTPSCGSHLAGGAQVSTTTLTPTAVHARKYSMHAHAHTVSAPAHNQHCHLNQAYH